MREILRRHRPAQVGERMIVAHDDRPWVAQYLDRLELFPRDRQQHESDVQLARGEQVDEVLDVGVLPE